MKSFWHTIEKVLGIYRWHPELALRYLPIVYEIEKSGFDDILEVGSGGLGIAPYLKKRVIGVDIDFLPPMHPQLIPIKASGEALPFSNDSFEAVVSTDTLEHITPKNRAAGISEMLRTTRNFLYICVPCGELAEKEDRQLAREYEQKMGRQFAYFKEHLEYGLPKENEIINDIHVAADMYKKRVKIQIRPILSIGAHAWLMRGWMTRNFFIDLFFRKLLLLGIPLLLQLNKEPTYRKLFIVEIIHA